MHRWGINVRHLFLVYLALVDLASKDGRLGSSQTLQELFSAEAEDLRQAGTFQNARVWVYVYMPESNVCVYIACLSSYWYNLGASVYVT